MLSLVLSLLSFSTQAPPPQSVDPVMPADTEIQTTASGLKYSVLAPGSGPSPKPGTTVLVNYSGWLASGTLFDSSVKRRQPIKFVLGQGQMIKGLDEGVALMRRGARCKLTIPPELAFGAAGKPPKIPADAMVVFEVELIDFAPAFRPPLAASQTKLPSGIVCEVLAPGEGDAIKPGQAFDLRFAVWGPKQQMMECSALSRQTFKGQLGNARPKFLDEVLPLMKPGTQVRLEVPAALAFADADRGPNLPGDAVTVWELELLEVKDPLPLPEFTPGDPARTIKTASGLSYEVLRTGSGATPRMGQEVTVHYAGWLSDGTVFDSSFQYAKPSTFRLGEVVQGWNEGLQLMKEGAVLRLTVPPQLGYGVRGDPPDIPSNATLVFYLELIAVGG